MIKSIPLNKLVQSPAMSAVTAMPQPMPNSRRASPPIGLLQNLIVRPAAKGKFEVEAGERRRRAMLALADDKVLARDHEVTCLVLEDTAEAAVETSLAENFHRLAMNPADEAQAFAALIEAGASIEDVARRFGLTVRFVEGRLRLATLAPVVFEALASGRSRSTWPRPTARPRTRRSRRGSSSRSRRPTMPPTRTASGAWCSRARSGAAIRGPGSSGATPISPPAAGSSASCSTTTTAKPGPMLPCLRASPRRRWKNRPRRSPPSRARLGQADARSLRQP
jgi:ParB/RepB/Spo0J family partition protein